MTLTLDKSYLQFINNLKNQIQVARVKAHLELSFFSIPWGHSMVLLDQVPSNQQRLWYAKETISNGWSRNVLIHQIKSDLYKRQVASPKTHNFDLTLSGAQSDLAAELLKIL